MKSLIAIATILAGATCFAADYEGYPNPSKEVTYCHTRIVPGCESREYGTINCPKVCGAAKPVPRENLHGKKGQYCWTTDNYEYGGQDLHCIGR